MNSELARLDAELAGLREQLRSCEEGLAERDASLHAMSVELAETNQGVVALYAELEDNALRLKEASDLKSRFLSYISHEFRTPLGSIRSMARILLDQMDGPLTDEQQKQVDFIQSSADRVDRDGRRPPRPGKG